METKNNIKANTTGTKNTDMLSIAANRASGQLSALQSGMEVSGISALVEVERGISKCSKNVSRLLTSTLWTEAEKTEISSRYNSLISKIF